MCRGIEFRLVPQNLLAGGSQEVCGCCKWRALQCVAGLLFSTNLLRYQKIATKWPEVAPHNVYRKCKPPIASQQLLAQLYSTYINWRFWKHYSCKVQSCKCGYPGRTWNDQPSQWLDDFRWANLLCRWHHYGHTMLRRSHYPSPTSIVWKIIFIGSLKISSSTRFRSKPIEPWIWWNFVLGNVSSGYHLFSENFQPGKAHRGGSLQRDAPPTPCLVGCGRWQQGADCRSCGAGSWFHRSGQASTACIWLDVPEVCWEMAGGESILGMSLVVVFWNQGKIWKRRCIAEESWVKW